MNNSSKWIFIVVVCTISLIGGIYMGLNKSGPKSEYTQQGLATLSQIELPDVSKKLRYGKEWLGKVVVVNHWATWCAPCREEIPMLIDYQDQFSEQGVQIVGIAHDLLDASRIFGDEIGISYPSLVAIVGGNDLLKSHGNPGSGTLPFTAVFDRKGNLARTQLGKISRQQLHAMVTPLL